MKRFLFRFEKLLRVRVLREEEAKVELAGELRKLATLDGKRAALEADLLALHDLMRSETAGGRFDAGRFIALRRAAQGTHVRIERVDLEITAQREAVDKAKAKTADCMRERSVLDKVREKDLAAWKKAREAQENLLLDEIGGRSKGKS